MSKKVILKLNNRNWTLWLFFWLKKWRSYDSVPLLSLRKKQLKLWKKLRTEKAVNKLNALNAAANIFFVISTRGRGTAKKWIAIQSLLRLIMQILLMMAIGRNRETSNDWVQAARNRQQKHYGKQRTFKQRNRFALTCNDWFGVAASSRRFWFAAWLCSSLGICRAAFR